MFLPHDITKRIYRHAFYMNLVVKVRAGRAAGLPDVTDLIASFYRLPLFHEYFIKVGIFRNKPVAVLDGNHSAKTAIPACFYDNAVSRGDHWGFKSGGYIDSLVHLFPPGEGRNSVSEP